VTPPGGRRDRAIDKDGFVWQGNAVIGGLEALAPHRAFDALLTRETGESRRISAGHNLVGLLLGQPNIRKRIARVLGPSAQPVRCWTVKNGVPHCEPPVGLLRRMVTLRWHIDAVGLRDGCIRVLPGSHRMGRLTAADISKLLVRVPAVDVPVPAGAVLFMSPLLVHSSRRRTTQGRRRVLHVELAAGDPPMPLRWAWA
jgi:ectoine hydroxylase-related dioxygenase (phytanoyl-CoA dioxygenase family)